MLPIVLHSIKEHHATAYAILTCWYCLALSCRLERPLIANVSLAWNPEVHSFRPSITHAGIEHLTIAFPLTPYPGHFKVWCAGIAQCSRPYYHSSSCAADA
jgi:hypothetical protein